jgi:hypothetical protein
MGPAAIDKMLKDEPPRRPLTTLAAIWEDFRWRRLARGHRDPCIVYTADAPTLMEAIFRACRSKGPDGKLFFHQGRVWEVNRDAYCEALQGKPVRKRLKRAESFHEVWDICTTVGGTTHGIGAITSYDVTARLAAWFGFPARRVYLHGGVIDGCRALDIYHNGAIWIPRKRLPPPIRYHVNLDEVEDMLCGYRVLLERMQERRAEAARKEVMG